MWKRIYCISEEISAWEELEKEFFSFGVILEQTPIKVQKISRQELDKISLDQKKDALIIAATDLSLAFCKRYELYVVGIRLKQFPKEELFACAYLLEEITAITLEWLIYYYCRTHQIPLIIGETKRCVIKEMTLFDLDDLYLLYQSTSIKKFIKPLQERKVEEELTRAYIKNMYEFYDFGMWLVREKNSNQLVARAGLDLGEIHNQVSLEVGYAIDQEIEGCGFGYEIVQFILSYAKEHLSSYHYLYACIDPENIASIKLIEKIGFIKKGTVFRNQQFLMVYQYSLKK